MRKLQGYKVPLQHPKEGDFQYSRIVHQHGRSGHRDGELHERRGDGSGGVVEGAQVKYPLGIGVESMISKRPHTIWRPLKRSLPIDGKGLGRLGYATGVVSIKRWIGKGYSSHHRRASSQDRDAAQPVSCATSETGTGNTTGRAASVPHLSFNRKNLLLPFSCVCSKLYSRARSLGLRPQWG
jgi:hypothetical protein